MSIYLFQHPKTKEVREVHQPMNSEHVFFENGVEWNRVFTVPRAAVDVSYDPFSSKDFVRNTANKKETMGDIWDRAKEASLKREDKDGVDLIKQKHYENYSKKRKGKIHPQLIKENQSKTIEI